MFVFAAFFIADIAASQHYDIFLARPAAGPQAVIGGANVDSLAYDDETRVFEAELGPVGNEWIALEPGVNHPDIDNPSLTAYPSSAAALHPGDALRLQKRAFAIGGTTSDLFYWSGFEPVTFTPATAGFRVDGGDPLGSTAGAGGAFDDHPFLVVDSDSLPGIYLASVVGIVNDFHPSPPVYLVMGTEGLITAEFLGISQTEFEMLTEDELDAALEDVIALGVQYVEANLIPEPSALGLIAVVCTVITTVAGRRRCAALRPRG